MAEVDRIPWVQKTLDRAESRLRMLRRTESVATYLSLLAGWMGVAVTGPAVLAGATLGSWRATCAVAMLNSLVVGLATTVQKLRGLPASLERASTCAGKLRALELSLTRGTRPVAEVDRECEELLATYADVLG